MHIVDDTANAYIKRDGEDTQLFLDVIHRKTRRFQQVFAGFRRVFHKGMIISHIGACGKHGKQRFQWIFMQRKTSVPSGGAEGTDPKDQS